MPAKENIVFVVIWVMFNYQSNVGMQQAIELIAFALSNLYFYLAGVLGARLILNRTQWNGSL